MSDMHVLNEDIKNYIDEKIEEVKFHINDNLLNFAHGKGVELYKILDKIEASSNQFKSEVTNLKQEMGIEKYKDLLKESEIILTHVNKFKDIKEFKKSLDKVNSFCDRLRDLIDDDY